MKRFYIFFVVFFAAIGFVSIPPAVGSERLIDILREKGVITGKEAMELRGEIEEKTGGGLLSLRNGKVKIGGELELEFIKSENNSSSGNNPHARFSIDKVVLSPQVYFTDSITFRADIEAEPSEIKVDEAWIEFKDLPYHTFVKVGLEDIFIKPHRKTEDYPINGYAFFQDEDLGIFAGGDYEKWYWRASITNGRRLANRRIQEDNVYPIIHEDDDNIEQNHNKEIGIGVGLRHHFKEGHEIDLLPFYYKGELSGSVANYDISLLKQITTYGSSNDDTKERYGINVEYILKDFTFFAQYIKATDGTMKRTGWYLQPSYKVRIKDRKTFNAVEFVFRYDDYDVDLTRDPSDSRTWDRQKVVLAAITDVAKNLKIKTEYYFNEESTGGGDVDNNELLVQFEAKF
ncbi:MAG: hypothetical protein V3T96_03670 [Thermodesulfobacteriota bacterium]